MRNREVVELCATVVLAACAVVVTTSVVRDRIRPGKLAPSSLVIVDTVVAWFPPESLGRVIGEPRASARVVEFIDYECPVCARAESVFAKAEALRQSPIARVVLDFPLQDIHPFALDAAHAAECASRQLPFAKVHRQLLERQRRFGKSSWARLVSEIGPIDTTALARCMQDEGVQRRVGRADSIARSLGLAGTPTFLIGHTLYRGGLSLDSLARLLASLPR